MIRASGLIKGVFVSVWDDGISVTTKATINIVTGKIETDQVVIDNVSDLIEEYFISDILQEKFSVCPVCHSFISKPFLTDSYCQTDYEIEMSCTDPDCDNYLLD